MKRYVPTAPSRPPRVSVVIPCYNYGHFLSRAVHSAVDQAGVDVDVLVVDDASTDDGAEVALALSAELPQVRVLRHPRNLGHIATYNDGLAQVDGRYVVLLSADDLLTPGSLARAAALMEAHPSVGLVYGYVQEFVDGQPLPPVSSTVRSWSVWEGGEWLRNCCRQGKNMVFTPEVMMRTSVLRRAGGYRSDLPHSADFYLWLQSASLCDVGRVNGAVQAYYRVHGANMHLTDFAGVITDLRERGHAVDLLFAGDLADLDQRPEIHQLARHGMAREARRLAVGALVRREPDLALADAFTDLEADLVAGSRGPALHYIRWLRHRAEHRRVPAPLASATRQAQTLAAKLRWRRWRWRGL